MITARIPERHINQRNFAIAGFGIFVALIAGFFISEFRFLKPPELDLVAPTRDIATDGTVFDVKGRTDPDADLTLNGRPLYSGATGEFTERVYLVKGVNELVFVARNRYGKTTSVTRYIVAQ